MVSRRFPITRGHLVFANANEIFAAESIALKYAIFVVFLIVLVRVTNAAQVCVGRAFL